MITYLTGLAILVFGLFIVLSFFAVMVEDEALKAPKICRWIVYIVIGSITIPMLLVLPYMVGKEFLNR